MRRFYYSWFDGASWSNWCFVHIRYFSFYNRDYQLNRAFCLNLIWMCVKESSWTGLRHFIYWIQRGQGFYCARNTGCRQSISSPTHTERFGVQRRAIRSYIRNDSAYNVPIRSYIRCDSALQWRAIRSYTVRFGPTTVCNTVLYGAIRSYYTIPYIPVYARIYASNGVKLCPYILVYCYYTDLHERPYIIYIRAPYMYCIYGGRLRTYTARSV